MNPLEDDDISHDSEAYRRWKGGTDTPQSEYLGNAVVPHPTAGLDTALPLAFRSFFATAWCSFLIVFNIILRFGGEGAPPVSFHPDIYGPILWSRAIPALHGLWRNLQPFCR